MNIDVDIDIYTYIDISTCLRLVTSEVCSCSDCSIGFPFSPLGRLVCMILLSAMMLQEYSNLSRWGRSSRRGVTTSNQK